MAINKREVYKSRLDERKGEDEIPPAPPPCNKLFGGDKRIVTETIIPFLEKADCVSLSKVSKRFYGLFNERSKHALLSYVAKGNQDKVARMPNATLLLHKGDVTDYSDRTFKNISAYQYALWALDTHMVRELEANAREAKGVEGEAIRASLLAQRTELQSKEISYYWRGERFFSKAYNPSDLFATYEKCIDKKSNHASEDEIWYEWNNIGLHQLHMPAHAIQEMLTPRRSFDPTPTFKEKKLVRTFNYEDSIALQYARPFYPSYLSLDSHHRPTTRQACWDQLLSPSSDRSAYLTGTTIYRGNRYWRGSSHPLDCDVDTISHDLNALKTLFAVRTAELIEDPDLTPKPKNDHSCCIIC